MSKVPDRQRHVSKAAKEWSEDEASVKLLQELKARATDSDDNKSARLRSRRRTASAHTSLSDGDDSHDEDEQPLSGLRSGKRRAPSAKTGSEAEEKKSRRSIRRLSTARAREAAVESASESEEVQGKAAPAKRQRLRNRSQTAVAQDEESPERPPAGRSSARVRAASHSSKALPAEQKHQPEQQLKSRGTRVATRARAAALQHDSSPVDLSEEEQPWPRSRSTRAATRARAARLQHDSTPEESSEEEQPQPRKSGSRAATRAKAGLQRDSTPQESCGQGSEPEALHLRHARGSRPKRKASKLVQGGGGISDDDDSASDIDNFIAPSEDDPEEVSSQAAANADDSDAQTYALDPAAAPKGGQTAQGKPGSATLRRIRKAQSGAEGPAIADGLADALADSERENQPENAAEHGQQSDAGYQRYTPEQKGKQKVVEMLEDTGPSGLHEALTPAQAAKQQSAAAFTPALRSSGLPPSKRRRLQKANGQTVKEEEDPGAATGVRRSSRVRKERPEYKALWQKQAAKAKTARADSSDELADSEDDGGLSDHADKAGPIIDDDEDDGGSGATDDQDGASEGADARGGEADDSNDDIDDFSDEPDDGMQVRSPLQLAGLFENRPDVDNCFNFYLDYLLECIADPDFPEVIRGDSRARKHYDYAIHKIEIDELARWRETYTKSDAWKRAIPGFITALERLPGCSVQPREAGLSTRNRQYSNDLADEDLEGTVRECAACMRKHTRAVMQLVLKGKLGDPGYIRGAKRLRDMAIRDDDEGQNESDRESILGAEDGEPKERVYDVGSHCASRVHLYHSLWHYKRRLRCQLKKELKAARLFLEGCGLPHTKADCVKHVKDKEGLYDRLRSNFKRLDGMAKEYATMQATGGFRHASGTLDRVTKKVSQLMYRLNDDSDADSGSKLQSDTDGEIEVVSDETGPSGLPKEAPEEAAAQSRRSSGDVRRRLVLGDDDSEAEGTEHAEGTLAQPSRPAAAVLQTDSERSAPQARAEAPLDSNSEVSAPQARAGASARHRAGQVIDSSSEEEMQGTGDKSRHSKAARRPQRQYRKPDGQPRYVPPAKRQSGRRAEDALKMAAASFQASPSGSGPPAAMHEKLSAPGTPEHSGSPSKRPQPYFMASPQRQLEGSSQQQAHRAVGEPQPGLPEPRGQRVDAPGIGTDLGALLRQAQGSDAAQRLASLALPERQDDSHSDPGIEGASGNGNSEAQPGVTREEGFQQMALEAAAASREALAAAFSYPDDSPCSPEAGATRQQHFQHYADAIELDSDAQDGKRQADGRMEGPEIHAEHSAAHVASTDHELALALEKSEMQAVSTQTSSKSQSILKPQRSVPKQSGGGNRGSRGRGDATKGSIKVQKDADSVAKQKSILKYFSPRS